MIWNFKDRVTVFRGDCPKGFPANLVSVARRKLAMVQLPLS
jgi:hypothetical protein